MDLSIIVGKTSQSVNITFLDEINQAEKTGLTFESAGLAINYSRAGSGRIAVTPVTLAAVDSAYSSGGFKEIDAVNMKGVYRFDIPNAALAAGTSSVKFTFAVTGCLIAEVNISLLDFDLLFISAAFFGGKKVVRDDVAKTLEIYDETGLVLLHTFTQSAVDNIVTRTRTDA